MGSKGHKMIEFQGQKYYDDRLFVLYLAKSTVVKGEGDTFNITVYHEQAPEDSKWCLVTYSNTLR